jgi:hypothetical protein
MMHSVLFWGKVALEKIDIYSRKAKWSTSDSSMASARCGAGAKEKERDSECMFGYGFHTVNRDVIHQAQLS